MDLSAIADALAARYAANVTTPPAGYKAITGSTARPPNNIPNTPFVIVWPQDGDMEYNPGTRSGELHFQVVFYYSKSEGDVPREYVALEKWVGVLLDQTHPQMQLGLAPIVVKAWPLRWEIGTAVYGGDTYEVIILYLTVYTRESVTLVA
jgi:hypothetical protein